MTPPADQCRRWKLTTYHIGDVRSHAGPLVTMRTPAGAVLARVPAGAFVEAALEGATKLADGRLVGVASPPYGACDADEFAPVYDIAVHNGWVPAKVGYAGIRIAFGKATSARNFEIRKAGPGGWPIEHGVECSPFRTLAADIGALPHHDPTFKGKGGVVPIGTRVYVLELAGKALPDGTTHDGWCTVNDTGGGIYGAHFDVFAGSKAWSKSAAIPAFGHIWFEGIDQRLPAPYAYGLA